MVQGFHIENVNLTDKLLELPEVDSTTYGTSQEWHWIRKLGWDVIERGQVLLMICHLGHDNKHWVALVVDGESKQLAYGNSMSHKISEKILIAYQEWFSWHSSAFTLEQLLILKQVDLFSCGILAKVALKDTVSGHISKSQGFDPQAARLRTFIDLVNFVLERVSTRRILQFTSWQYS